MEKYPHLVDLAQQRIEFRQMFAQVTRYYPNARFESNEVYDDPDLSMDVIHADANKENKRLFVFTFGEHGIEAFFGFEVLRLFISKYLPLLDHASTGLLIAGPLNPWGQKHLRRVNHQNVDLNRNFVVSVDEFQQLAKIPNGPLWRVINPASAFKQVDGSLRKLLLQLALAVITQGKTKVFNSILSGQYTQSKHLYFGGDAYQPETLGLIQLMHQHFPRFGHVLHIDCHTGYGPRDQMSMVCSAYEDRSSSELSVRFKYPLVVKANPKEFYEIHGDLIDYEYRAIKPKLTDKPFFAAAIEFGTLGDTARASLKSLQTMMLENQAYHQGSTDNSELELLENDFVEMYYPSEAAWKEKALQDANQALEGMLSAEGYLAG